MKSAKCKVKNIETEIPFICVFKYMHVYASKIFGRLNKRLLPGFTSGDGWGGRKGNFYLFCFLFYVLPCHVSIL